MPDRFYGQTLDVDDGIVPDPAGIITGGQSNKTARTVSIREGDALNAEALQAMFEQIIANNRAGGWRRIKREGGRGPGSEAR